MAWLTYAMRQLTQPETGVEGGQTHQPRIWTTVKSLRGKIKPIRSWRLKSELGQEFKVEICTFSLQNHITLLYLIDVLLSISAKFMN